MRRIGRLIYNILPYYIVKKLVFHWSGEGYYIMTPKNSAAEWSATGLEIDYGEWLMIADEAALMKERKVIEGHLNANQRKLDDLKKRMAI